MVQEKKARVEKLIQQLALQACRNTTIGSSLDRGVSGGEVNPPTATCSCVLTAASSDCVPLPFLHSLSCMGVHSFMAIRCGSSFGARAVLQMAPIRWLILCAMHFHLPHFCQCLEMLQLKRTNVGIALVASPRVLFLDEPTSGKLFAAGHASSACLVKVLVQSTLSMGF